METGYASARNRPHGNWSQTRQQARAREQPKNLEEPCCRQSRPVAEGQLPIGQLRAAAKPVSLCLPSAGLLLLELRIDDREVASAASARAQVVVLEFLRQFEVGHGLLRRFACSER